MKYLDKYPCCIGCPVLKYCGTAVQSTKLCNSYSEASERVIHNNEKVNFSNNSITERRIQEYEL